MPFRLRRQFYRLNSWSPIAAALVLRSSLKRSQVTCRGGNTAQYRIRLANEISIGRNALKFEPTPLADVFVLDLVRLEDERGFFGALVPSAGVLGARPESSLGNATSRSIDGVARRAACISRRSRTRKPSSCVARRVPSGRGRGLARGLADPPALACGEPSAQNRRAL